MENVSKTEDTDNQNAVTDKAASNNGGRPTTLNILLDNGLRNPLIPSFRPPSLDDLQPILKSEVEKLLQQWKSSPQTPGSFLNPKNITEEQEHFANAFTQKLNELRDPECLASLTAAMSPAAIGTGNLNLNLPELNSQNLPNIVELCRQAVQQPGSSNPPILLYSPTVLNPQSIGTIPAQSSTVDVQQSVLQLNNQGSVAITLPTGLSVPNKELTTLQLSNGLKFEITTGEGVSRASVLKMLGLDATNDLTDTSSIEGTSQNPNTSVWPLKIQTSVAPEVHTMEGIQSSLASPRIDNDTRPPSVANSLDQVELNRPIRSSSSISSNSSISQSNGNPCLPGSNNSDIRLDPNEQYRMRLERKRARNRDAARKCRERKIRLIKSLEKDVFHLSEENKALRTRLSRSKVEVERLRHFVVNHLEQECPAIANKVM